MTSLNHKLARDLWRMKGQAIAIAMVIATGVMLLVMMSGIVTSLEETRRAYYERNRLAHIFAPVKRAPIHILRDLAALPGVSIAEGRVTGSALVSLPELNIPIRAQAVSLPDDRLPRLNAVHLTHGRQLDKDNPDEIILLNSFAKAHKLMPGDQLSATMNGIRRKLVIVGLAQSPEFLYSVAPGELISDDSRFAVLWMNQTALASAFDMQGAFNEALLSLGHGTRLSDILNRTDALLDPYGGFGSYGLKDHTSDRFVTEEITGMKATSKVVPPIFLAVAAFLLNIVISRMVQSEREQIGLIKAFGYTDREIGAHYFKFILAIAIAGTLIGCLSGIALGRLMMDIYQIYYKFPILVFTITPASLITAFVVSILAASTGGLFVLRQIFALTPAVAMRPPAPSDYSKSGQFGNILGSFLDQPSRMILRRIIRQPWRMAGSLIGIACGMALSVAMIAMLVGFDRTMDLTFSVIDRSDLTVTFTHPLSHNAIYELAQIPGIRHVEPSRSISVEFQNGLRRYRGGIHGLIDKPNLNRAINSDLKPMTIRHHGIILSKALADNLDAKPGNSISLKILEGRRPHLEVPVLAISESLLGSPAYMHVESLNKLLNEPNRVSTAHLLIDMAQKETLFKALKARPYIAGVSLKSDARTAFQKVIDSGAGSMRFVMMAIAAIITFGIVYNAARIAYAERQRDLASLRVMGFTKQEAAFVLLGELALITLAAIPLGALLGTALTFAMAQGFSTDLYQIPILFTPASYGTATLAVLGAAITSGWLVKRDIDRLDLVSSLKIRE